ncbi:MAG TPA: sugar phosphate isomerase/epimerase [Chloroflexota bacterium]|nr:sugar phosphate isomerase/epimerase [Chloroflexota bacterium]
MTRIRVACQTFTWEMLGPDWHGSVSSILDWIAAAGYAGVEITNHLIGEFFAAPDDFQSELSRRGLALAAFGFGATGFSDPLTWDEDIAGLNQAIEFLRHFPEPRLALGGASSPHRLDDGHKLNSAIRFYNEAGRLGRAAGVSVNVHPHSNHGSLVESAAEYRYLVDRLDPDLVSFGPDTGHIVRGGQDLLTCLRTYLPRITHLHLKDVDGNGNWTGLGRGVCDFPAVLALLEESAYGGWVVAEEESFAAREDGVRAIRENRAYLRSIGY